MFDGFVSGSADADNPDMNEKKAPTGSSFRISVPADHGLLPAEPAGPRTSPANPAAIYLSRLAPSGRRTMRRALDTIAELASGGRADADSLPWPEWRHQHSQALRAALVERGFAPASVNKHLSALKGVLEACFDLELISGEDLRRATKIKRVSASPLPAGRGLSQEEVEALFGSCSGDSNGDRRDAAILATLFGCGLRRSEAVVLDLQDVDLGTGEVRVHSGKGRRDRVVWTPPGALEALRGWVEVRGRDPGPLFVPVDKAGNVIPRRLHPQTVLDVCRRRANKVGIAPFSPHDARRSYVGALLNSGVDIVTVGQLAGHSDVTTTAAYDRRPETVKRQAASKLHIPYTGAGP